MTSVPIVSKINSVTGQKLINLVYVGSFDPIDRDINLLLETADFLLKRFPHVHFYLGGATGNPQIQRRLRELSVQYPGNFHYLGYISRKEIVSVTEKAHVGFFLIRPDTSYWVKCSPNKIFEYIACGVVPVIRADCEFLDELSPYCLAFERYATGEEIMQKVAALIQEPTTLKLAMEQILHLREKFLFGNVMTNYETLYTLVKSRDGKHEN